MSESQQNDGGPIHPQLNGQVYDGMSLRDWFAGQALAGRNVSREYRCWEDLAQDCYEIADATLAAREQPAVKQSLTAQQEVGLPDYLQGEFTEEKGQTMVEAMDHEYDIGPTDNPAWAHKMLGFPDKPKSLPPVPEGGVFLGLLDQDYAIDYDGWVGGASIKGWMRMESICLIDCGNYHCADLRTSSGQRAAWEVLKRRLSEKGGDAE